MEQWILLTVAYEGTQYCGWQKQKNLSAMKTVQSRLELSLSGLYQRPITTIGASRTDAGVHALGQRALFHVESPIPAEKVKLAVIPFLPEDITVVDSQEVPSSFHPRFDAKRKTYRYQIWNDKNKNPLIRNFSQWVGEPLDVAAMKLGAKAFVGCHDFQAFCASGSDAKTTLREIYNISIQQEGNMISIFVTGNGFLYNMVRIISGTLIYCGLGKIMPICIPQIIQSKNRALAGKTMGPQGLTLMEIEYE